MRLTAGAIVAAVLGVAVSFATSASAESTPSAYGSRLVTLVNEARAAHGLRALTVAAGTSTVAAGWTSHLAAQQALSHNPNLAAQLESHGSPNWTTYAENVADGDSSSADGMFQAYMNSPEHRANILDPSMRYIGVGVVFSGSFAWNTLDFVDQYSGTTTTTTITKTTTPTKSTTTTAPKTTTTRITTAAPRIATKSTTSTPRVAAKSATRVATVHRAAHPVAKPRTVSHAATPARPAAPAAVPAVAHILAPPSPVALSTPAHGSGSRDAAPIVAALLIAVLVAVRFGARRLLRAN
jgi:hypothetical protein